MIGEMSPGAFVFTDRSVPTRESTLVLAILGGDRKTGSPRWEESRDEASVTVW